MYNIFFLRPSIRATCLTPAWHLFFHRVNDITNWTPRWYYFEHAPFNQWLDYTESAAYKSWLLGLLLIICHQIEIIFLPRAVIDLVIDVGLLLFWTQLGKSRTDRDWYDHWAIWKYIFCFDKITAKLFKEQLRRSCISMKMLVGAKYRIGTQYR